MDIIGTTPDGKLIIIVSEKEMNQGVWVDTQLRVGDIRRLYAEDCLASASSLILTRSINCVFRGVSPEIPLSEFAKDLELGLVSVRQLGEKGKKALLEYINKKLGI